MEEKKEKTGKKNYSAKRFTKQEMDDIISQIDQRLHDFMKAGKYKEVLIAMGNLGKYSLNNQIFILMQMPSALTVNGMKKWNSLGRHIIPESKGIKIFRPVVKSKEVFVEDEDGVIVEDKDGNMLKKRKDVLVGYQQGYVFDVSQTDGKPIDVFKFDEGKTVENKDMILNALRKTAEDNGFGILYANEKDLGAGTYGECNHLTHEIRILEGMSDLQEISTTVHELGHALAHSGYREDFKGLTQEEKRGIKEVEAESIACVVCTYLGLDTENFNFSYIAGWSDGDIGKFKENLEVISKHARTIIDGIENEFALVRSKEKEEEKAVSPPAIWIPKEKEGKELVMG